MKISAKKLQANQQNAKQSSGPLTPVGKRWASQNGRTYGFFAKILRFDTEEEAAEYHALVRDLTASFKPLGTAEELLVDRLATLTWHDRKVFGLLQRQLGRYENPQLEPQLAEFLKGSNLPKVAIPGLQKPDDGAPADQYSPWECREMVVRVTNDVHNAKSPLDELDLEDKPDREGKGFHVEARLGQALDTLLRYHTTFERSFERTLNQLLKLQALRLASINR